MKYEEMSDFEINQAVTREVFGCHGWASNGDGTLYHCGVDGSELYIQTVADYCNNPSDAWHIILEHNISILSPDFSSDGKLWSAECHPYVGAVWFDKNPLRAAMMAFLATESVRENG